MQTSGIPENPGNAKPSPDNESSSTSARSSLTPSEQQLIFAWRRAVRSGWASQETAALWQLVFTETAVSLRQSIYDLQTMLTLFGVPFTSITKDLLSYEIKLIRQALGFLVESWTEQVGLSEIEAGERDLSANEIKF